MSISGRSSPDWIHTPAAADQVVAAFTQVHPLSRWLVEKVSRP